MSEAAYVHIVDSDYGRRAQIAHQLYGCSLHAEIYEDLDELISRCPSRGAILISDDTDSADPKAFVDTIRSHAGALPVAFFAERPSVRKVVRAMLSGALDYLEWPFSPNALEEAVVRLHDQGEQRARSERRKAEARELVGRLTPRELEVLEFLIAGESSKVIGQRLGISPRTVEVHRSNLMARLNARSVSDAVRIGLFAGVGE